MVIKTHKLTKKHISLKIQERVLDFEDIKIQNKDISKSKIYKNMYFNKDIGYWMYESDNGNIYYLFTYGKPFPVVNPTEYMKIGAQILF
jgi:hypothetical protein